MSIPGNAPGTLAWARAGMRQARRLRAYRTVRRAVLGRIQRNHTARELMNRVFEISAEPGSNTPVIPDCPPAGRLLAGRGVTTLPVAVISLVGVPGHLVDEVVDEIARLQVLTAGFRPIFVLDGPQLGSPRRYGYVAEMIVSASAWNFGDQDWEEYAAARIASITATYGARLTMAVPATGLDRGNTVVLRSLGVERPRPISSL